MDGATPRELVECIPKLMARACVPGLSIALVRDGELTWSAGFGIKHRDSAERVNADTVFQAASLSKPVFAYAVLTLVERGVLALDTPLATYVRHQEFADEAQPEEVTARHVLSHTTGWPNWRPTGQPLRRDASRACAQALIPCVG